MRVIKKEDINKILYVDREQENPACNSNGDEYTCRTWLQWAIDMPHKDQKLNRKTIKQIESIYNALNTAENDVLLEEADYEYLKDHIENIGINSICVYKTITSLLDSVSQTH